MQIFSQKIYVTKKVCADIVNSVSKAIDAVYNNKPSCTHNNGVACICLSLDYCYFLGGILYRLGFLSEKKNKPDNSVEELICKIPDKEKFVSYCNCKAYPTNLQDSLSECYEVFCFFGFCAALENKCFGKFDFKQRMLKYYLSFSKKNGILFLESKRIRNFRKRLQIECEKITEENLNTDKSLQKIQEVIEREINATYNKKNIKKDLQNYRTFLNLLNSIFEECRVTLDTKKNQKANNENEKLYRSLAFWLLETENEI